MAHTTLPLMAYLLAAGLLTITPGVDTAMVLRVAAADGPRNAAAAALGICAGCLAWGCGAAFGLTALLAASTAAFTALKWAGALYLLWLGVRLLLRPREALVGDDAEGRAPTPAWLAFRRGLVTNLLNPKIGIFYITFLPQFIPAGVGVAAFSMLLATIHVTLGLLWFAVLILLTVPLGRILRRRRTVRTLDRLTGTVFVGFGIRLALAERG